jgi:ferrochelatase
MAADGRHNVLVVPIAFTSDHIETLSEIDIEYAELAHELGLRGFSRAPSLNARPAFLDAMADLVRSHLANGELHHPQYRARCPGCRNPSCRQLVSPATRAEPARAVA